MKRSEIYKLAQIAVLDSVAMGGNAKLEILRELMGAENLALYCESKDEENKDE